MERIVLSVLETQLTPGEKRKDVEDGYSQLGIFVEES
jgi:hypothetical protein